MPNSTINVQFFTFEGRLRFGVRTYGPVILIVSADTVNVVLSGPVMQAGPPDVVLGFLGLLMYAKAE